MICSVITPKVTATSNSIRFDQTIGVQRQQLNITQLVSIDINYNYYLHALWQYELASTAGTGTVLTVTGQYGGTLGHHGLLHLLGTGLHQLADTLLGQEVHNCIQITVSVIK